MNAPDAARFAELLDSCEQPIAKTGIAAALLKKCLLFTPALSFTTADHLFNATIYNFKISGPDPNLSVPIFLSQPSALIHFLRVHPEKPFAAHSLQRRTGLPVYRCRTASTDFFPLALGGEGEGTLFRTSLSLWKKPALPIVSPRLGRGFRLSGRSDSNASAPFNYMKLQRRLPLG